MSLIITTIKPSTSIRVITTSSLVRRFTIDEETAILDGSDTKAKVIRKRLISAPYADLDFEDLTYGIAYVVNYLDSINSLYKVDASTRIDELLSDGTEFEKYTGEL